MGCCLLVSRGQASSVLGRCSQRAGPERGQEPGMCPLQGPLAWAWPAPIHPPHPPPSLYAPAVHNDGAGAAPVALVHLPATRNDHEARGHLQRERGTETHTCGPVFLFSPPAQGRGGKRARQRNRGWRPRTRDGVGGTGLALSLRA